VLLTAFRYLGPKGCLSFLVVQTIASLEQKASKIDADGDGKVCPFPERASFEILLIAVAG
jgi:hypothetical protein